MLDKIKSFISKRLVVIALALWGVNTSDLKPEYIEFINATVAVVYIIMQTWLEKKKLEIENEKKEK